MNGKFDSAAWISQKDAAKLRGVRPQTIASLIKRGRLTALVVAGRRLVSRSEIESFKSLPAGRPTHQQKATKYQHRVSSNMQDEAGKDWISQANAAKLRNVSRQAISDLVKRGRLSTVTVAGRTLVLRSEVEAFEKVPKFDLPPQREKTKPNPDKRKKR